MLSCVTEKPKRRIRTEKLTSFPLFFNIYFLSLKRIRSEKNISQGDLTGMIGMHATHISRYERDLTQPTLDVVRKIAEKLNVSADQLIYGDSDQKAKNNINDQELLNMFSQVQTLNKQDLSCVKALLHAFLFQKETQQRLAHH
jgi:transcriptional regulator with XRE-family HTH domain